MIKGWILPPKASRVENHLPIAKETCTTGKEKMSFKVLSGALGAKMGDDLRAAERPSEEEATIVGVMSCVLFESCALMIPPATKHGSDSTHLHVQTSTL